MNEGAPGLARQGFYSLSENEKSELDKALKTVENLTKIGKELSEIDANFCNLILGSRRPVPRHEPTPSFFQ